MLTPSQIRTEHGFTLVELLVAMSTGMVVVLALFAILEFATRQTARITDTAQANQLGRIAMTKIVDELHSACISPSFAPIQEKSSENELRFINAYSEAAVISEAKVEAYEHRIAFNEKAGTLTDYTFPETGGTWPNFTFTGSKETPTGGTQLATGVEATKSETTGKALPVFQYYGYATTASSGTEAALSTLSTEPLALSGSPATLATNAPSAASVLIRFTTSPTEKTKYLGIAGEHIRIPLSDQVTFAFSAPRSETTATDAPCQ
jgi:competence protein ComGC